MKMASVVGLMIAAGVSASGAMQESPKFFKLDFVVKEVDAGKTISSHPYSVRAGVDAANGASIRTGSKMSLATGTASGGVMQYTYFDTGINFDVHRLDVHRLDVHRLKEGDSEVSKELVVAVSSVVEEPTEKTRQPVIRQNQWTSMVTVKVGKPTMVFSSDDVSSKRQMSVELTATPIR